MNYSLNESSALCRKATRGAGFSWGISDDVGRAIRNLEASSLPGTATLADYLESCADYVAPIVAPGQWTAPNGALCPLRTGAALCDHAHLLADGPIMIGPIRQPLLLIAFADMAAQILGKPVAVTSPDLCATCDGGWIGVDGDATMSEVDQTTCSTAPPPGATQPSQVTRATIPPDLYARLDTFAQRTYAPATEASRLAGAGAGAGLSDND